MTKIASLIYISHSTNGYWNLAVFFGIDYLHLA